MFESRFMPCPECGDSVERADSHTHRCDPDRQVDFRMFGLRHEIEAFETRFRTFLTTATGRFEEWAAARKVRGGHA